MSSDRTDLNPIALGLFYAGIGALIGLIAGHILALVTSAKAVVIRLDVWLVLIGGSMLVSSIGGFASGVVWALLNTNKD